MNNITYTQLDKKIDIDKFLVVLKELFPESNQDLVTIWKAYLEESKDKFFWVARDELSIVGIAITHQWKVLPKPGKYKRVYWQLSNLFLNNEYRGNNIGSDFLSFILAEAKSRKVEKIITFAGGEFSEFFIRNDFENENTILLKKFLN